ncbi:MAG: hypothetical protein E7158_04905 [Firmicutes bacterium]|nr:hypothetical protein [Bacillota bacterium]
MDKEVEFLKYIYQNAKMGIEGIDDIKKHIETDELKELIARQKSEYESIANDAILLLNKSGAHEDDISALSKAMSYMMVNMKMLKDDSESNIAKLMIEGSNKGVIQITEKINSYTNVNPKIIKLAKKLLATEEHNIEELKIYL